MNVHLYRVIECDGSTMYILLSEGGWHPVTADADIDEEYAFKSLTHNGPDSDYGAAFLDEDKSVEMLLMDVAFKEAVAHMKMCALLDM
ncbi:hypothetical protein VPMG_00046 [Vibrio phage VBP32]|uniref:Uncharacterized protein n=2 Tax=Stoningtonvirus VBP47 TaxID=2846606 RepID=M4SQQ4_9CAUD|nr:hypothetical protein VPNG_00082 [Vibrio phage VBP47]YP_007676536.1 hypothetical protein VPMG_00046 [Vibrio phage VBP32]AGH57106.1 hypothetical protein VPNG_00082 [Vibrio phage VBP47]AGH57185.1 hypothetical protein VPMG_00046 [Vibrio phage VBP32]